MSMLFRKTATARVPEVTCHRMAVKTAPNVITKTLPAASQVT